MSFETEHWPKSDDVTRALPHAVGPEKSILSSMLQDPQEFIGIAIEEKLTAEHFHLPSHSILFTFIVELFEAGREIELVSLIQKLIDAGKLDRVGGPSAVTDIYSYSMGSGHFRYHLQQVRDKYVLRSIIQRCNQGIADAYDSPDEPMESLDTLEKGVMAIRDGITIAKDTTIRESVATVISSFERELRHDPAAKGIPTGFEEFDRMTGGFRSGEMTVVGARPSMGKSAIMLNCAERISVTDKIPGLIFSAEMSKDACVKRIIFSRAKFALSEMSKGYQPNKGDLQRIQRASLDVADAPLYIDDQSGPSIGYIAAKARRMHRDHGIQYLMVDYLQKCKSGSKQAQFSREREIAEISAGLFAIGKDLGIAIVVLAQLNRNVDARGSKGKPGMPRMSDLRESGSIEQDADIVALLHRDDYGMEDEDEKQEASGRASLILAKNRNGETGIVPLTWIADLMRFETGQTYVKEIPKEKSRWDE
jgi:replicative DNA helicase